MKTYKSKFPEITLKLKKGEVLNCQIKKSEDANTLFRQIWDADTLAIYESVICIFLNRANNTLGWLKVSQGGLSGSVIDKRLILATALNCLASSIIMAHNHPGNTIKPSDADITITRALKEAGALMDIQLLDHLILTENEMKVIKYNKNTSFIGRNGLFNQSGIMINEITGCIALYPITSKGQVGRACLTIPKDKVLEFVKQLLLTE